MSEIVGQCPICRIGIHALEEHVVDEGRDFHPHCWMKMIGHKLARLEQKAERKDITLSEAEEAREYREMIRKNIIEKNTLSAPVKKSVVTSPCDTLITRPNERLSCMTSNRDAERKRFEELREKRWLIEDSMKGIPLIGENT